MSREEEAQEGDETLECKDCGASFVFSAAEQEFFREKGFENKPGRCKACKEAKKARFDGGGRGGGDRRGGDDRRGGGGGGYGDRDRGDRGGRSNVCYAFQKGECDRGSSCRFSHEGGGGGGGGGGRGGGRSDGRGGGDRSGGGSRGPCYANQRGECDRGSSCRFSHE